MTCLVPWPGSEPGPPQWNHWALTTRTPENPPEFLFCVLLLSSILAPLILAALATPVSSVLSVQLQRLCFLFYLLNPWPSVQMLSKFPKGKSGSQNASSSLVFSFFWDHDPSNACWLGSSLAKKLSVFHSGFLILSINIILTQAEKSLFSQNSSPRERTGNKEWFYTGNLMTQVT